MFFIKNNNKTVLLLISVLAKFEIFANKIKKTNGGIQ
jgi:hypothetical protein